MRDYLRILVLLTVLAVGSIAQANPLGISEEGLRHWQEAASNRQQRIAATNATLSATNRVSPMKALKSDGEKSSTSASNAAPVAPNVRENAERVRSNISVALAGIGTSMFLLLGGLWIVNRWQVGRK